MNENHSLMPYLIITHVISVNIAYVCTNEYYWGINYGATRITAGEHVMPPHPERYLTSRGSLMRHNLPNRVPKALKRVAASRAKGNPTCDT